MMMMTTKMMITIKVLKAVVMMTMMKKILIKRSPRRRNKETLSMKDCRRQSVRHKWNRKRKKKEKIKFQNILRNNWPKRIRNVDFIILFIVHTYKCFFTLSQMCTIHTWFIEIVISTVVVFNGVTFTRFNFEFAQFLWLNFICNHGYQIHNLEQIYSNEILE